MAPPAGVALQHYLRKAAIRRKLAGVVQAGEVTKYRIMLLVNELPKHRLYVTIFTRATLC